MERERWENLLFLSEVDIVDERAKFEEDRWGFRVCLIKGLTALNLFSPYFEASDQHRAREMRSIWASAMFIVRTKARMSEVEPDTQGSVK